MVVRWSRDTKTPKWGTVDGRWCSTACGLPGASGQGIPPLGQAWLGHIGHWAECAMCRPGSSLQEFDVVAGTTSFKTGMPFRRKPHLTGRACHLSPLPPPPAGTLG